MQSKVFLKKAEQTIEFMKNRNNVIITNFIFNIRHQQISDNLNKNQISENTKNSTLE